MNNFLFGRAGNKDRPGFGYYETICGGGGAGPGFAGAHAVHTHMTNTRITDPEVLEDRYPVRLRQFSIRRGSGGTGRFQGGDGVVREFEFLEPLEVSLLTNRRTRAPFGLNGGGEGTPGKNLLLRSGETTWAELPSAATVEVQALDIVRIETPGGGGYGPATAQQGLILIQHSPWLRFELRKPNPSIRDATLSTRNSPFPPYIVAMSATPDEATPEPAPNLPPRRRRGVTMVLRWAIAIAVVAALLDAGRKALAEVEQKTAAVEIRIRLAFGRGRVLSPRLADSVGSVDAVAAVVRRRPQRSANAGGVSCQPSRQIRAVQVHGVRTAQGTAAQDADVSDHRRDVLRDLCNDGGGIAARFRHSGDLLSRIAVADRTWRPAASRLPSVLRFRRASTAPPFESC